MSVSYCCLKFEIIWGGVEGWMSERQSLLSCSSLGMINRALPAVVWTALNTTMRSNEIQKVKVKLSLCFNWTPRHEGVLGEWRYSSMHSWPRLLYPQGKRPGTPWIGGWWAPGPVWTRWWREKFPVPAGTRTPDHPARSPALYHWAIPASN
jgi:hypothetical protein